MAKGDELEDRLIRFAVMVIQLCDRLPSTSAGRHIAGQLLRSGTSPAPNYSEGRGAESRSDFIHKFRICLKELNESTVWLKMIRLARLLPVEEVNPILDESEQLGRIIGSSIKTAAANQRR